MRSACFGSHPAAVDPQLLCSGDDCRPLMAGALLREGAGVRALLPFLPGGTGAAALPERAVASSLLESST